MRILAVDTSTMSGSLALLEDESLVAEWSLRSAQTHNRRLLGAIDFLLDQAGWTLNSVDGFAVASGPGSFTGLRIGMTTIKVLAWTTGKLYAGIPSLDALALPFAFCAHPVCALIDARKKEVYCALYRPDAQGGLRLEAPYAALSPSALAQKIKEPVIFCGDGWTAYRDLLKKKLGSMALEPPSPFHAVRAASVGELARGKFLKGESQNPESSLPVYVRPSEAEIHYPHLAEKSNGTIKII